MDKRSILITGGTGILGSWVLGRALERGFAPVVLMRDATLEQARQRLEAVLALPGYAGRLDEVRILLGDTCAPDLGLSDAQREALRGELDMVIHCAASISFNPKKDFELQAANVDGLRHMINLLDGTDVPLYHVSTAYVAGMHTGRALENELLDTVCKNTYERTKREAECLFGEALASGRVRGAIFRPSVIVGALDGGLISQFHNFYSILRMVDVVERGQLPVGESLRLQGNPESTLNLIPVDWVADALWRIVEREGASGQTYHLTNPNPCKLRELNDWATRTLNPSGCQMGFQPRLDGEITRAEQVANASLSLYRYYLQDEPVFDRANTDRALAGSLPCPHLDGDFFDMLLAYARQQEWVGAFGCKLRGLLLDEDPRGSQIAVDRLQKDLAEDLAVAGQPA
ncbi:MAG: SDR family oxidoreductase [Candidatus Hydrogenedentes bacterium]|nr:SDR family oxidoreductase [Candidatus Hydrogenedentota bacterium]